MVYIFSIASAAPVAVSAAAAAGDKALVDQDCVGEAGAEAEEEDGGRTDRTADRTRYPTR